MLTKKKTCLCMCVCARACVRARVCVCVCVCACTHACLCQGLVKFPVPNDIIELFMGGFFLKLLSGIRKKLVKVALWTDMVEITEHVNS